MWKMDNHFVTSYKDLPKGTFGFVYLITNKTNGKKYIGKKTIFSKKWVPVAFSTYQKTKDKSGFKKTKDKKKSKKGSPVWNYKKFVEAEMDWLSYNGSSKELLEDIRKGHLIEKEIIDIAKDGRELTYLEVKHQFKNDVLEREDFYNSNILSKFFTQIKKDVETKAEKRHKGTFGNKT